MIDVDVFSKAGIGKSNEDYVLHSEIAPDISLIVVCDGMGGLSYGAEASSLVAHSIAEYLESNYSNQLPEQSIGNAIKYANDKIGQECIRLHDRMGASIALTLFVGDCCYYTWLGDVRIYHRKDDVLELLTKDHLAIEGNHSFITRCINGKDFRTPPKIEQRSIRSGEEIYIVTDGYYLYNEIGSATHLEIKIVDDATCVTIKP